ncbi:epidermal retinol dehydrogenase 2-like [Cimex lectularius]|uniref:Short-chain dehydrogenase/reductase 3 n=1 Tax=Cimex lectularius TaxID=79782 RepID=A0A8I6S791_CIMLE|nr:epidermal retinol dehydrogenase 2-like [Cimex lectularius]
MSKKRFERDVLEWTKFVFEMLWGVIVTAGLIIKEIFELVVSSKSKSLVGQHVLVTGAARGLGREICLRLIREGCSMTCVDVMLEGAKETAAICNAVRSGCAKAKLCDITDRESIKRLLKDIPPVDVLINNAGIVSSADILEVTDEHIEKMMAVNVMSHFWTIRAFLPGMIERGRGHIVAIASAAAFTSAANIAPYTATKYAVTGMMASLREEFRRAHPQIKTTTIHPFFITPPPSSVEHWNKESRIPDVTAGQTADMTVMGIKKEKITVTVPAHLYFLLLLLQMLPSAAGELWRDMFYANINSLDKKIKA